MARRQNLRNLNAFIEEYVSNQKRILAEFRKALGPRDWVYLTDVPRKGTIKALGEDWLFRKHGTGVCFEVGGTVIDANNHLEVGSEIFDAGRLVDYAESIGEKAVLWRDEEIKLDHDSLPSGLREMARSGVILRCTDLTGEIYRLIKAS